MGRDGWVSLVGRDVWVSLGGQLAGGVNDGNGDYTRLQKHVNI